MTRAALILLVALTTSQAWASDSGKAETCESYERATCTIVTECRRPERKPTHCESFTSITGTMHTECR